MGVSHIESLLVLGLAWAVISFCLNRWIGLPWWIAFLIGIALGYFSRPILLLIGIALGYFSRLILRLFGIGVEH